jgi:ribose-phosphate pyrophosphokinase
LILIFSNIINLVKRNYKCQYDTTEAKIFTCTQSKYLAEEIAAAYGVKLGNVITSTYSDGEFQPSYEESIRGTSIFIIGSTNPGPKNLMEMLVDD